VSQLGAEWPELRLVIAGDGSLRGALEAEAAALGIADRVHLLGARNDVPDVLAALDVFAMPSEWEPFGLAAAEAMAAGLPVVASEVGGLPEVVAAGVTGILVPACEPEPLAAGIATLLREPATRRAMGEAGRARVQAEFSAQAMGNRMCSLYERLLGAKGMEVGQ
jgi:glycosyltransferase involved in cell wall biosynthesis